MVRRMRIATWNVAYGLGTFVNQQRLAQMLRVDADVWILTETHDSLSLQRHGYVPTYSAQRPLGDGTSRNVIDGSRWVTVWSRSPVRRRLALADASRTVGCVIDTEAGDLVVYGTVLPWYNDTETAGMDVALATQRREWKLLTAENQHACVAGDFNVNLGGPHYYGSKKSKAAVAAALSEAGLTAITDFSHTPEREYGLIDHIAFSTQLAKEAALVAVWPGRSDAGKVLSDHPGVATDVSLSRPATG